MMATARDLLPFLCIFGSAGGVYKQWIPDTNFESSANWDKGSVPCGSDRVVFPAQREVAVYVKATHTLAEMHLPMHGEFILASGAGFSVRNGQDPSCGAGVTAEFKDSDSLKWFNPAMWEAASSKDDFQKGSYLFFVHEESVPCQYDDVVFRDASSFQVNVSGNENTVTVKSVSVLGQAFSNNYEFSQYANSPLGKLQIQGSSSISVRGSACPDTTGCQCGNAGNSKEICKSVQCSPLDCQKPLRPAGHCCDVCGAIVTIQFTSSFNLDSYRQRLQHLFLALPKYNSIQMAVSKVSKMLRFLGVIPYSTTHEIQVVLLDQNTGSQSGTLAETLARDIVKDINSQGSHLGIESADFLASSNDVTGLGGGEVAGIVLGVLVLLAFMVLAVVLYRRGQLRMPRLPSISYWKRDSEIGELGGPLDHGFDNPMFEKPQALPDQLGLYGTDSLKGITLTHSGVHFVNPVYDETDLSA
ncbi:protein amnionless [Hoplias malabaricus]|uniref:protein amnionless n=1 Tax=Hoplias malabaricus TaxID=27720 RepID=UPI00346378AE